MDHIEQAKADLRYAKLEYAKVGALIAIAEQLKVANRIALATNKFYYLGDDGASVQHAIHDRKARLDPEIAKVLGLDVDPGSGNYAGVKPSWCETGADDV